MLHIGIAKCSKSTLFQTVWQVDVVGDAAVLESVVFNIFQVRVKLDFCKVGQSLKYPIVSMFAPSVIDVLGFIDGNSRLTKLTAVTA